VLEDQVDDLLAAWRGIIFANPHLRAYDENPDTHKVDTEYAAAVKKRIGQWVLDTARAHTLGHIRARDLIAFCAAIVVPMKPYLAHKKSLILQVTLWSQPFIREGDF
jgi:hypothetical protein